MKKLALLLCCMVLAASLCVVAASCVTYSTEPGKMNELVGTYKLTTYDVTPDAEPGDESTILERTQDYMEINGVEAYVVVTGNDKGYYFYKDNDTPWTGEIVKLSYEYSTDNNGNTTDRIQAVKWEKGYQYNGDGVPGSSSERLGFNKKLKNLNVQRNSFKGEWIQVENTITVAYTRVSDDVTTAYAFKTIGKSMNLIPYEIKKFNGMLAYSITGNSYSYGYDMAVKDINPFIYCFVDFNNVTLDATVYYALKGDYADGKRDAELKKTAAYKVELKESNGYVNLNFKFADADDNPVFRLSNGTVAQTAMGSYIYYEYDSEAQKYVVSENTNGGSLNETLDVWNDDGTMTFEERLDTFIEAYAQTLPQPEPEA